MLLHPHRVQWAFQRLSAIYGCGIYTGATMYVAIRRIMAVQYVCMGAMRERVEKESSQCLNNGNPSAWTKVRCVGELRAQGAVWLCFRALLGWDNEKNRVLIMRAAGLVNLVQVTRELEAAAAWWEPGVKYMIFSAAAVAVVVVCCWRKKVVC